ncbi:MAG: hypothetical protein GXP55_02195 [Deltaproteobacteria bacterium]|nr:hypothetical protein [Deltaproteobacteria bacterium]
MPFIRGFAEGEPSGYWFLGIATEETIDSFWVCRDGDDACPLDPHHRIAWDHVIGHPIFSYLPGDPRYSHWWQMWTVRVPDETEADSLRSVGELFRLAGEGRIRVERTLTDFGGGPTDTIMHCALVLRGTELEDNGGPMPDGVGRRLVIERRVGWRQGYRVEFFDFTPSEGVFPPAAGSGRRPRMPAARLYIAFRSCQTDPPPAICELPGLAAPERRPISEPGLGQDITGDGDVNDTNNVAGALPCQHARAEEPAYSPLWAIQGLDLPEGSPLQMIDESGVPDRTDLDSAVRIWDAVAAGLLPEPRRLTAPSFGGEPSNESPLFFNCPGPVPEAFVPYPCQALDP